MSMLRTRAAIPLAARAEMAAVYAEHAAAVFGFASVLVGPCRATEVTVDVFVNLIGQMDAGEDRSSRTALLGATLHAIGGTPGSSSMTTPSDRQPPRAEGDPADACGRLDSALQKLPPAELAAIAAMSYCDEGGETEVAAALNAAMVLGASPEVLLADLRSGLTRLAELLGDQRTSR